MSNIYEDRAKVFKALADEKRLRILELLQSGEKCACVLIDLLEIPQSSLSYHMKILTESGIVEGRVEGKWTHYRISPFGAQIAVALLMQITSVDEECLCQGCHCQKDRP